MTRWIATRWIALSVLALAAGVLLALGVHSFAEAQGAVDAGVEAATNPAARAVLPVPTDDPGWFVEHIRSLWRSGAISSALVLGLFGVAAVLRARVGWFSRGRQAVIVAAVLGTLTMLATDIANGGSPNLSMVLSSVMAGVLLYVRGESVPK